MELLDNPKSAAKSRSVQVFKASVERHFSFLKDSDTFAEAMVRGISLPGGRGTLLPLSRAHIGDDELIATLARWRGENSDAFPTRFPVTKAGTARWLEAGVLGNPGRVTFLVLDRYGRPIGHLGFAGAINDDRAVEVDNVVRGVKGGAPGLMGEALDALIAWAVEMLLPEAITLRVFKDNEHAIHFYCQHGFVADCDLPLVKVGAGDTYSFELAPPGAVADRTFLRMRYVPDARFDGKSLILSAGPTISSLEASYASDATRHGWNSHWSDYLERFEREFAEYVGVKHAMATSSGTGALHLALLALGVGPGDEVIVPDLTWVATGNSVAYCGGTPIFADVSLETWTLDPAKLEQHITDRTKAIMPVHLYGHPAEMDRIVEIATRHGIPIIEDAAPAIGAECRGRKAGTFGAFSMFSFQGAKLAVTGEGGMLVTDDDGLYEQAHLLWDQGRVPGTFWIQQLGWKYKMSNVQAAIGLGQVQRAEELIEAKRRIHDWYLEDLAGVPGIHVAEEADWARSIYWMTSIRLDDGIDREKIRRELRERNVDTRPVFPAISTYPFWEHKQEPQPVAEWVGRQSINLPSGHRLSRAKIRYISDAIKSTLNI